MSATSVIREVPVGETARVFAAIAALRPQLGDEAAMVRLVDETLRPQGYRVIGVFEDGEQAVAVAGFRIGHSLSWGRYLYVDDLSTVQDARRRGHARRLLDWLADEARREGCEQLHLDSGLGHERADAYRLYLNARLEITGHHFARFLGPDA